MAKKKKKLSTHPKAVALRAWRKKNAKHYAAYVKAWHKKHKK